MQMRGDVSPLRVLTSSFLTAQHTPSASAESEPVSGRKNYSEPGPPDSLSRRFPITCANLDHAGSAPLLTLKTWYFKVVFLHLLYFKYHVEFDLKLSNLLCFMIAT